jgi:hypothetical protein
MVESTNLIASIEEHYASSEAQAKESPVRKGKED